MYTSRTSLRGMRYARRAFSATDSDCEAATAAPSPRRYLPATAAFCAVAGAATARLLCCCTCSRDTPDVGDAGPKLVVVFGPPWQRNPTTHLRRVLQEGCCCLPAQQA